MGDDVLDVKALVYKVDVGNHPQIVSANVDYPPLVPIFEIIKFRE